MKLHFRGHGFLAGLCDALCAVLLSMGLSATSVGQVSVLTHHNDNSRTGQNLSETYLTSTVVNSQRFGQLFVQPVDGEVVAEPLYVPNLQINGATHNVVFVATLHDGVYAFDADSNSGSNGGPLWYTSLIDPPSVTTVPIADQGCPQHGFTEMGILGTPVIDPKSQTLYLVAKTLESGNYIFRLHALNILTGKERTGAPVAIQGSYTSNGEVVTFLAQHRMNRPALLLAKGVIVIAFGTMGCKAAPPSTGWVMAYNASNLRQLGVLDVGPARSAVPGIWMGGEGPSADSKGNVYLATGDGLFDYNVGGFDYGDTLMKISLGNGGFGDGGFDLVDYFTPFNQADLDANDLDLGSSGPILLPAQAGPFPNLAVIAGKQGMIYLINQENLGGYSPAMDQVVQEVPFSPSYQAEIDGSLAYWNGLVYLGGVGVPIEAFSLSDGVLSTVPAAMTADTFNFYGFSVSANGEENGILWGVEQRNIGSMLDAFEATGLKRLYRSPQLNLTMRFTTPMVANGKVYVATANSLVVMGLLAQNSITGGNKQSGLAGTTLPTALSVTVNNAYTGSAMPGVSVSFSDGGSGGSFGSPTAVTNAQGVATTSYTLPGEAGVYRINASGTAMMTVQFTETATTQAVGAR